MGTFTKNGSSIKVEDIKDVPDDDINTSNGISWFILEDYKGRTDVCIFTVKDYDDGVKITSDLLCLDKVVEIWDASTYTNETVSEITRGGTTNINSWRISQENKSYYSVNGVKTERLVRGLNIVRMEDGTVKKVIIK